MNLQEIISEILEQVRGMWRYRWRAVGVAWFVAVPGWLAVFVMPDVYEASARVTLDTNKLLPALTKGLTATEDISGEVDLVSKALLTRPNLQAVARETDLDLRADTPQKMEDLITRLQAEVVVTGGRDHIFNISYHDVSRDKATEVVSALLNTFVESSLGAQGDDADTTERAMQIEIENHERRLLQAEEDLAQFKKRNLGFMPDDGSDYYTRLKTAIDAVDQSRRQIRLVRERRDEIARQVEGEEPVFGLMSTTGTGGTSGCSKATQIAALESQLASLLVDFTDKHPRVVILEETIATLSAECQRELATMPLMAVGAGQGEQLESNPVYQNLRMQLSNANVELAELEEQLITRDREVAQLRADVDKIAEVETELKRLNRDYGVIADRHQELLRRWESLQSKKRLDVVTEQVQFNILEPPFASLEPVSPNRPVLLIAVVVLALGAGGAVAFVFHRLRPVYFSRHSVKRRIGLPVLGTVSMIHSQQDIRSHKTEIAVWTMASAGLFAAVVAILVVQEPIRALVQMVAGAGP